MKKNIGLMVLAVLLILCFTGCGGSGGGAGDEDQINGLLDQAEDLMEKGDLDALVGLCAFPYDADGFSIENAADLKTKLEEVYVGIKITAFVYSDRTITVNGNTPTVDCTLYQKGTENGNEFQTAETYRVKCAKVNGWKMAGFE